MENKIAVLLPDGPEVLALYLKRPLQRLKLPTLRSRALQIQH